MMPKILSRDEVERRVKSAVASKMGRPVYLADRLVEDLGCDSLDVVHPTMGVEEEFGIEIPDADVEGWTTVGAIAGYVRGRIGQAKEAA